MDEAAHDGALEDAGEQRDRLALRLSPDPSAAELLDRVLDELRSELTELVGTPGFG